MTSSRLKAMQERFAATAQQGGEGGERGPSRYYPLGKMEIGDSVTVRFIPDKNQDNPMGFLKEVTNINLPINGGTKRVTSLETWGEPCPIVQQAREFFNSGQKELGTKLWRKKDYIGQVLVIEDPLNLDVDPANPIKLISIGKQIFDIIREAIVSGDIENDPDAFIGGHNFVIKKTKGGAKADGSGFYPTYTVGTKFANKPSDIPAELVELIEANQVDLNTVLPSKPELSQVHADLQAALTSMGVGGSAPTRSAPSRSAPAAAAQDDDPPFEEAAPAAPARQVSATTADLLNRIKQRT